jgi:hypothetical protein
VKSLIFGGHVILSTEQVPFNYAFFPPARPALDPPHLPQSVRPASPDEWRFGVVPAQSWNAGKLERIIYDQPRRPSL